MYYTKKEKLNRDKREFIRDRVSMYFGSLTKLYENHPNPPLPDELFQKAIELAEKTWELGTLMDEFSELDEKLMIKAMEEIKERQIGRYYCSELWDYFTGKIPPEKFLEPQFSSLDELKMMEWGVIIHKGIQSLFGYEEKKIEIYLKHGITLIGKVDLELESGELIEIKTKEFPELYDKVPLPYLYQCTAYMYALNKPKMRLYLISWHLSRKRFDIEYDPKIWQDIEKRLYDYHERVLKYASQKR
jgi:CRISPR/Cas system-associated exonuclease Cas4 (RecB family)